VLAESAAAAGPGLGARAAKRAARAATRVRAAVAAATIERKSTHAEATTPGVDLGATCGHAAAVARGKVVAVAAVAAAAKDGRAVKAVTRMVAKAALALTTISSASRSSWGTVIAETSVEMGIRQNRIASTCATA